MSEGAMKNVNAAMTAQSNNDLKTEIRLEFIQGETN